MRTKALSLLAAAGVVAGTMVALGGAESAENRAVAASNAEGAGAPRARSAAPRLPGAAVSTRAVAPGVLLSTYALGSRDPGDRWTVQVNLPATPDGPLASARTALGPRATADRVAAALRAAGFTPRVDEVRAPAFADRPAGRLGWTVRVGSHAAEADAVAELARVRKGGFAGGTRYTAQDGDDAGAPQQVHVLRVDFTRFGGRLETDFGPSLKGTEKLTELLGASDAIAGINGQWFYDGAPAGLYVKDGRLIGSATRGRAGIRITGGRSVDVDTFTARVTLRAGAAAAEVDGVNRPPGVVWNCGGVGGDLPTELAQHDLRCTDPSELVRFTPEWGAPTPSGAGAEAVLDAQGTVLALNGTRGTAVPAGGSTVQALGESARWLREHAVPGTRLTVEERVEDGSGRRVALTPDTTVLQVGPTMVRDGRVSVNAVADGVVRQGADQTFTYNWTVRANPRSMIGVDGAGRLMLVVVDGRRAGYSEGLGVAQAAELMHRLGAREAMNLDGGGSSVMATADAGIVNRPSDATGERSLGNVLLLRP
ncbi:phosphodiester glycosidase family protein [Streptomyces sp. C10-9-1]|uniref:phosphodiester glycosidase family protein n=1 Tax=Streptomyces sp. C10-9-1 TaxID=1859285 RepID=UPI003D702951